MTEWRLVDGRDPVDDPDDFPTIPITSEADLRQELDRLRKMEPGIVSLSSPTNEALQIGIGGAFAGLRWYQNPKLSQQRREILADHAYCANRVDFMAEGDTIAFWPENLMPVDQAISIVVYFFNHQSLPEWSGWKEWDAGRGRWNIKPPAKAASA